MSWQEEFALVVVLFAVLWFASLQLRPKWNKIGYLKSIDLYPLKGGCKLASHSAFCTRVGLRQSADESDKQLLRDRSARQLPRTLLIKLRPNGQGAVTLDAPDTDTFHLDLPLGSAPISTVTMLAGECVETIDCGDDVARWLSRFLLGRVSGLRLGYNDGTLTRNLETNWSELMQHDTLLSNEAAGIYSKLVSVSVTNQKSIDDCNAKLWGVASVTAVNFRHNLLVDGPRLKAFDEDCWDYIRIGREVELRKVKDCLRCAVPGLDPETAKRHARGEPIKTLNTYRMGAEGPEKGNPKMGIYCEVRRTGNLKVGDPVYVTKR